jgi:uncharacterized protein YndB with AHSA1/START domain
MSLPPIRRDVTVSWDQATAFRRFVEDFGSWWPARTHSVGGERVRRVVFECRPGGLIFEEHVDGRRFQWGKVLEIEPPRRVKFTWHPSRAAHTAQHVEVRFEADGAGTRVELISDKWENWGKNGHRARRGYDVGWSYIMNVWCGRRTGRMVVMDVLAFVMRGIEILRGGTRATIARADGEIARASAE